MGDAEALRSLVARIRVVRGEVLCALEIAGATGAGQAPNERANKTALSTRYISQIESGHEKQRKRIVAVVNILTGTMPSSSVLNGLIAGSMEKQLNALKDEESWKTLVEDLCGFAAITNPSAADGARLGNRRQPDFANDSPKSEPQSPGGPYEDYQSHLPQLGTFRASLGEEGGNSGTFDKPDVKIELSFDEMSNEDIENFRNNENFAGNPPNISLGNCLILVSFDGGEIHSTYHGEMLKFTLSRGPAGTETTIPLSFSQLIFETSPAEWHTKNGEKGRRLYGQSQLERLCSFEQRPSELSVSLKVKRHDVRLDYPNASTSDKNDLISKILEAYVKEQLLQRSEEISGYYLLRRQVLI